MVLSIPFEDLDRRRPDDIGTRVTPGHEWLEDTIELFRHPPEKSKWRHTEHLVRSEGKPQPAHSVRCRDSTIMGCSNHPRFGRTSFLFFASLLGCAARFILGCHRNSFPG